MDNKIYDVVILGAGPAGLAAGLYAGRSRLSVLILEKGIDGGQIAVTHDIENYPGQSKVDGMTGQELVAPMTEQCKKFGCERVSDTITACDFSGPVKKFVGSKGEDVYKRQGGGSGPVRAGGRRLRPHPAAAHLCCGPSGGQAVPQSGGAGSALPGKAHHRPHHRGPAAAGRADHLPGGHGVYR